LFEDLEEFRTEETEEHTLRRFEFEVFLWTGMLRGEGTSQVKEIESSITTTMALHITSTVDL
jgi:hypothetical protein